MQRTQFYTEQKRTAATALPQQWWVQSLSYLFSFLSLAASTDSACHK
uniref:Uncharacterized protein n=1 Tax=Arundo donax TaxID=35708 RepID=A0A0A9GSD3_ARUDO